jgi:UDP:flavonoid glycosyltransferase YjiC (YdhE family)
MILLPLFWDQYDNAQRMDELGFGVRLATYAFTDAEMSNALSKLLGDSSLKSRLTDISKQIQSRDGLNVGADVIESVGLQHKK